MFYAREGRVAVGLRLTLPGTLPRSRHLVDIYNRIIYKNIHRLHAFLSRKDRPAHPEPPHLTEFREDLTITKLLHTEANFDVAEDRSQYKQGEAALRQQRLQLKALQQNIIAEEGLERSVDALFGGGGREASSGWLRENLTHMNEALLRKFRHSLQLPWVGEKRI